MKINATISRHKSLLTAFLFFSPSVYLMDAGEAGFITSNGNNRTDRNLPCCFHLFRYFRLFRILFFISFVAALSATCNSSSIVHTEFGIQYLEAGSGEGVVEWKLEIAIDRTGVSSRIPLVADALIN